MIIKDGVEAEKLNGEWYFTIGQGGDYGGDYNEVTIRAREVLAWIREVAPELLKEET